MEPREQYENKGWALMNILQSLPPSETITHDLKLCRGFSAILEDDVSDPWWHRGAVRISTYGVPMLYLFRFDIIGQIVSGPLNEGYAKNQELVAAVEAHRIASKRLHEEEGDRYVHKSAKDLGFPESDTDAFLKRQKAEDKLSEPRRLRNAELSAQAVRNYIQKLAQEELRKRKVE